MCWTDDPLADFDRWDAEQTAALERLPRCCECYEPIQDEVAYYINGEWVCEACMDTYRRVVEPDGG